MTVEKGSGFTAGQIAAVLSITPRAVRMRAATEGWAHQEQKTRGGITRLYPLDRLPADVQAAIMNPSSPSRADSLPVGTGLCPAGNTAGFFSAVQESTNVAGAGCAGATSINREELWAQFARRPARQKERARRRLAAIQAALALIKRDMARKRAYAEAARIHGFSAASLERWVGEVKGYPESDWLPLLAPNYVGRTAAAVCAAEAWDYFKADYLRLEQPAGAACYDRLLRAAAQHGWAVPSLRTLERRIEREIPQAVRILAREGTESLQRAYPAQVRDRSVFRALEAVNADGHKFDVFVRFPDGDIARPVMVAWQDIYSAKILAWRVDRTENTDTVRLSFGDVVERHGIPSHAYLDNGRGFASKWMTGGTPTRYRFKVLPEEPAGILTLLLGESGVHWTTPYHGQAKPIERAFRDLCEYVAKHPAFAGAYTGNKPDAKPENYASRAVPFDQFMTILDQEIAAHNARAGRRGGLCNGRSFDAVFAESYARSPIKKATAEQRRLWLLAAETASSKQDGTITLATDRRNRYWAAQLTDHAGETLVVRFDPQTLHERVYVYTHDGRFLCEAACIAAAGFNDSEAARDHSRARNQFKRAARAVLDAERRMDAIEASKFLPPVAPAEIPAARVVQTLRPSLRIEPPRPRELTPEEHAIEEQLVAARTQPQVIELNDTEESRYARARSLERRLHEGLPVDGRDREWLASYQTCAEYRAQKNFHESFGLEAGEAG